MPLLPAPANDYRGSRLALFAVLALAALNLFRGSVHFFTADGGASRIAGIDLTHDGAVVIFLFALMGIDQLVWGVIDLAVALRYRSVIPLLLAVTLVKQAAGAFVLWVWKTLPVDAPGKYGALVTLPLVAAALWLSLRTPRTGPR